MKELTWINYAKFRVAYGTVGNDLSASLYNYYTNFGLGSYFNQALVVPSNYPSNKLQWETTKTLDLGIELSLFDDRLSVQAGYYDKRSTDLIFSVPKARSAGSGLSWLNPSVLENIGTMLNTGWELAFNVDAVRTQDLTWSFNLDMSFLNNTIKKLPNGDDIANGMQRRSEGHSIYEWYTYHYAGVDQLTGDALYELDPNAYEFTNSSNPTGNFNTKLNGAQNAGQLREINGKYYVTSTNYASQDWRGTALPTVYGSFGTSLNWKGLSIGALFTYSLGGKTYDSTYASLMGVSVPNSLQAAYHKDVLNAWTAAPEGMTADSPNRIDPNGVPVFDFSRQIQGNAASDRWLTSSDYLVFKNLNVSYSLPQKWVRPLLMQGITVGMSVDNLFTITARKGMNPQYSFAGDQSLNFVTARVFSFQVTARF